MEYIYYLESIIYYVKQQCLMVNNKSHIVNIHRNSNKEFKTHKKNKTLKCFLKLWNISLSSQQWNYIYMMICQTIECLVFEWVPFQEPDIDVSLNKIILNVAHWWIMHDYFLVYTIQKYSFYISNN